MMAVDVGMQSYTEAHSPEVNMKIVENMKFKDQMAEPQIKS